MATAFADNKRPGDASRTNNYVSASFSQLIIGRTAEITKTAAILKSRRDRVTRVASWQQLQCAYNLYVSY